uniref:aldose epimerase family protein n=1 Tax=Agathobacter sp. TaxID=2021311 RepID=UPI0040286993
MKQTTFGKTAEGTEASLYTIGNSKGMRALVTNFGAALVSVFVKNKNGEDTDVVLGYDDVADYQKNTCYFGAIVGRSCNRIANARFTLNGVEYQLEANDNENSLHSGSNGTSERFWEVISCTDQAITLQIEDADLQQGYPGNAVIQVTYEVTEDNGLEITYHAKSDKDTVFNFTNHAYINLNGHASGSVLDQTVQIKASHFTPVKDGKAIPTGELADVEGTPFDFRVAKTLGQDINADNDQLRYGSGYDHNFALDRTGGEVEKVATAYAPESGIQLEVYTDCPGIQLYSANFIQGQKGKGGVVYKDREAFCLETQYFPNSINEPNFKSPITKAGKDYASKTIYKFSLA